jgi:hypothetical protein
MPLSFSSHRHFIALPLSYFYSGLPFLHLFPNYAICSFHFLSSNPCSCIIAFLFHPGLCLPHLVQLLPYSVLSTSTEARQWDYWSAYSAGSGGGVRGSHSLPRWRGDDGNGGGRDNVRASGREMAASTGAAAEAAVTAAWGRPSNEGR